MFLVRSLLSQSKRMTTSLCFSTSHLPIKTLILHLGKDGSRKLSTLILFLN